jgi:myo-inositol-1(or 4)-monophosphatase
MEELEFAQSVCAEAGVLLLERRRSGALGSVEQKGSITDLVTAVDREVDALVAGRIAETFPEDAILTEEGGPSGTSTSARLWILDPLDGTRNFIYSYPFFSVSLALVRDGVPEVGVVAIPYLRETFWAVRGKGAFLNGERIHVSTNTALEGALLSTGFACVRAGREPNNLSALTRVLALARDIRRSGSAAADLCYVACGRTDGFWELELSPWDVAAGGLLVREAGGCVTDLSGGDDWLFGREMLATNGRVHDALYRELLDAWAEDA